MKSKKTRLLVPMALALLALSSREAAAQAPTVTATVNGAVLAVQWNGIAGATGYDVVVTGTFSGSVAVPASLTSFQVTPPAGTYNIQVRATAGATIGPFSNTATVTIGGGPGPGGCAAPAAPVVTATTSGMLATVSWTAVAGALGYRAEFSRTPGGTELVQTVGASQTSVQGNLPFPGTFYVRVVTANACGAATSQEVSFSAGSTTPPPGPGPTPGTGPRTPNPVAGQPGVDCSSGGDCLLPVPSYAPSVVNAVAAQMPNDVRLARPSECAGGNNNFLFRLVAALRQLDTRWGLNYKRGNAPTLSEDVVTYNGTARPDDGESHVYLFDIAGGNCGSAIPVFRDISRVGTWDQRGQPYCGTEWCARWTIAPYLAAGYPFNP